MNPSEDESGISDSAMQIFIWFNFTVLCQVINVFGIVTNVINIMCFTKQGFGDSINISLLGLALSDLGSLITMVLVCVCMTPALITAELPFEPADVMYLAAAMPHVSFGRVSCCITAMITLERCLCITAPLQIKRLITPKRTAVINACIFVLLFFSGTPVFVVNNLGIIFSSLKNKTLVGLISTKDKGNVEIMSFGINNLLLLFGAFMIIVVCTSILSIKLKSQSKWRKKAISSNQDDRVSSRNQKAAKMVVMISVLFIVCFIPVNVNTMAAGLIPDLMIHGNYYNISVIICGLGFVLEGINASMNIFIYYHMSSVYRTSFLKLFERLICHHKRNKMIDN